MKTNHKMIELITHGFDSELITNLNENQINVLHAKLKKGLPKKENKEATTQNVTQTTYSPEEWKNFKGKFPTGNVNDGPNGTKVVTTGEQKESDDALDKIAGIDPDAGNTLSNQYGPSSNDGFNKNFDGMDISETDLDEKSVSQQQQKLMGLALSVKKGDTPKSKVSKKIKDVAKSMSKKDLEDFASTKHKGLPKKVENKESYMKSLNYALARNMSNQIFGPNSKVGPSATFGENLEKELSLVVEKHLPAKMKKKDLLNLLEQWEEEDDVIVKPSKPTTKPNPTIDPDDPYQPAPDREPAPRANKDELPQWFSFDKLGIEFKK